MWNDRWTGKTLTTALAEAVGRYGNREAFVFRNGRLGFRDLQTAADEVARACLALGVARGDRVAIWMAGYAEWAHLYFGLAQIGAVMVPLNTRYKPSELEYVLGKSEARLLVFKDEVSGGKEYAAILAEVDRERLPALEQVIALTERPLPGVLGYARFLAGAASVAPAQLQTAVAQVGSEDVAIIQFTSGTTAFPKGAQLFQVAMLRGADACTTIVNLSDSDRFFSPQPFYHAGGSIEVMLSPIVTGCTMVVQAYFDAAEGLRVMADEHCNVTMGHQPHYIEYLNQPESLQRRLSLEKGYIFANPTVNQMVVDRLGLSGLVSPFGMTETHLAGTACTLDDPLDLRLSTVGRPTPGVELEIREPHTGRPQPVGEVGEVCLRGWCLMKGYYQDPERTAEAIDPNGWFHTGDLGRVGDDGCLRLVGRIKDMLRVGGENVAAAEVEAFLLQHPAVKQAVVVGQPDARLGEVCFAFVERKHGLAASDDELVAYCRAGLASFKVPRQIRFVDEWPMSGTGKIQKFLLAEQVKQEAAPWS
jgi:acyl-CoA synthetase (AMP-forming)/AMP-acid ligase II